MARDVFYGRRGRINARELWEQMNTCSLQPQPAPAIPIPLPVPAHASPETWVPCPSLSLRGELAPMASAVGCRVTLPSSSLSDERRLGSRPLPGSAGHLPTLLRPPERSSKKAMIQPADSPPSADPHIPLWRRITALLTLGSLVVVIGVLVATVVSAAALLALFVLERAVAH